MRLIDTLSTGSGNLGPFSLGESNGLWRMPAQNPISSTTTRPKFSAFFSCSWKPATEVVDRPRSFDSNWKNSLCWYRWPCFLLRVRRGHQTSYSDIPSGSLYALSAAMKNLCQQKQAKNVANSHRSELALQADSTHL